ncbi:MAG: site-specific integrase [Clostridiales bacterium]|jgi:site-specific recombinase XerD|nr:site-specific integrase [Clostridiales bacterium]
MKKSSGNLVIALTDYFTSYLPDAKGLSGNTIKSYDYCFSLLFEYMDTKKGVAPEKVTLKSLDSDTLTGFLQWLETDRNCTVTTRNARRAALSAFSKFALKRGYDGSIPFYGAVSSNPKKKRGAQGEPIKYFTMSEIAAMLALPDTKTVIGRRDMSLMSMLYATGARAQEMCDLKVNDIFQGEETNVRLTGKGSKSRLVTIPENASIILNKWLGERDFRLDRQADREKHLFSSQTHEHMTISCIEEIVKKYVLIAKETHPGMVREKTYTPHSFRHSIAVHMLEAGESLQVIQSFLGHASIETTSIYAKATPELANKFLRERGSALDEVATKAKAPSPSPYASTMSFLKIKKKTT